MVVHSNGQEMEKYNKPSLPNPKCIFEDLCSTNIEDMETMKFTTDDESLRDAYNSYLNFKQLRIDISEQQELNGILEELNKELMGNIENMRKQQSENKE